MIYRLPICVLCDEAYARHLGAMLCSLLCNSSIDTEIEVHVLDDGISDFTRIQLESLSVIRPFHIIWHDVSNMGTDVVAKSRDWPDSLYKRLKIASILKKIDRILLLDADTIILKDPIYLFQKDLNGAWIGGVPDALATRNNIRLGLPADVPYVNFGVLLLDLAAWRKNNAEGMLMETLHSGNSFKYMDQDVLNLTLHQHMTTFDPRWNSQFLNDRYTPKSRDDFKNPSIIHYVTKEKPWLALSPTPRKHHYLHYFSMTPWFAEWKQQVMREKRTLAPWIYRLRYFFKEGFQIHIKHGERYVKFMGINIFHRNIFI